MKIAQVAPLYERVPPKFYGGTERVVSYLTEALVDLGHDVTLYASGDSETTAHLRPACPRALRLDPTSVDPVADHVCLVERVFQESDEFEVVHSHVDYIGFPSFRRMETPHVTTLHGRLDIPNLRSLFREFSDVPVVSISDFQRRPLAWANWQATVYHGLPENLYTFRNAPGKYLAFLGRISPEKRVDSAIEIAKRVGIPLKIVAKVDKVDQQYFDAFIKPLLADPLIEFIGEIGEAEKNEFLGSAFALLFPVDWPEPFGLAMIEAMACGTPVVACRCGSIPEVLQPGVTGFIVDNAATAHLAVEQIGKLSRKRCREVFEERFTAKRMALDYLDVYERIIASEPGSKLQIARS
jgi:glycosyltransferase involved in cell wall biosynthesis